MAASVVLRVALIGTAFCLSATSARECPIEQNIMSSGGGSKYPDRSSVKKQPALIM
jgi:hypothetical protein